MWVWLVGPRKAKEIFYPIGTTIDGKEAEKIGWANKSVPADKLEAEVNAVAARIAETPMDLLKLYKNPDKSDSGYHGLQGSCHVRLRYRCYCPLELRDTGISRHC
jgi:enoyl-CoA hydratase/carnithine racemase